MKSLGLLILRLSIGIMLIHHGYEKLANIENFADAFVRPLHLPFPIVLSYAAAFSEVVGSWMLITGLLTRFGGLLIAGTVSVGIYHALMTTGFNIYLLELLVLYFGGAVCVTLNGGGMFAIDYLILDRIQMNGKLDPEERVLEGLIKEKVERANIKKRDDSLKYETYSK